MEVKTKEFVDKIEYLLEKFVELQREPSTLFRPGLTKTSDGWSASYGDLVGKGSTPKDAVYDFNRKYREGDYGR